LLNPLVVEALRIQQSDDGNFAATPDPKVDAAHLH
jgi:hypothetical protein